MSSWQPPPPARTRGGVQLNKAAVVSRLLQSNRPVASRRYDDSSSSDDDDDDWGSPRLDSPPPTSQRGSDQIYELRAQAEGGDAAAQAALGTLLWAEDQREALRYLRLAAAQGHAAASYRLGAVAQAESDLRGAVAHFERAAEGGHAEAQLRLGEMLEGGEGVPRDTAAAAQQYRAAIAQRGGDHTEHTAANNLGELLVAEAVRGGGGGGGDGNGDVSDGGGGNGNPAASATSSPKWAEAQRFFERAAGAGFVGAQYNLGQMRLVEGDAEGAREWLSQAAEQEHAEAARSLATL